MSLTDAERKVIREGLLCVRAARAEALREAAAWIADGIGYPVQVAMPDHPMPDGLWDALVDHVHADSAGVWHGGELTREEVDAWLCEEANGPNSQQGGLMSTCAAVTIWPEVPPHGVRLACALPAGHDGDHACAEIEYLEGR